MAKLTLTDLANLQNEQTAVSAINANNTAIENAIELTLSRTDQSPNQMGVDLDMNSNSVINLPHPLNSSEAVRKQYVDDLITDIVLGNIPPETIIDSLTDYLEGGVYETVDGEIGVRNRNYPVGDVRRYGVFPDGFQVNANIFNGDNIIYGTPGTFARAEIGMRVWSEALISAPNSLGNVIIGKSADASTLTLTDAASATGVQLCLIGTFWEGDSATAQFMENIYLNAKNPLIQIFWPRGLYTTGMNLTSVHSGTYEQPSRMHFDNAEFGSILHLIDNVEWVEWTGTVSCHDRLGMICHNVKIENVYQLSDPNKHVGVFGKKSRGVHILGCSNIYIKYLDVEDTEPVVIDDLAPAWAAVALQTGGVTEGNFTIDKIRVRNSATHGVYLNGQGINIGEILVEGWGSAVIDYFPVPGFGGGLQDYLGGLVGSNKGFAVGLCRTGDCKIGKISISQRNASAPGAVNSFIILDSGRTANPLNADLRDVYVEHMEIVSGPGAKVAFVNPETAGEGVGQTAYLDFRCDKFVLYLPRETTLSQAGSPSLMEVYPGATGASVTVDFGSMTFLNTFGYLPIKLRSSNASPVMFKADLIKFSRLSGGSERPIGAGFIEAVSDKTHELVRLRVDIGDISGFWTPPFSGANPLPYSDKALIVLDGVSESKINSIRLVGEIPSEATVLSMTDCSNVSISNMLTYLLVGSSVVLPVIVLNNNTRVYLDNFSIMSGDTTGTGIYFGNGTHSQYKFTNGNIQGFDKGLDKHVSAVFSKCSGINIGDLTNSTPTTLSEGDFYSIESITSPTLAGTVQNVPYAPRVFKQTVGDGVATVIVVTHNLNTKNLVVSANLVSTGAVPSYTLSYSGLNTITFTFSPAPASNDVLVTIIG